MPTGKQKIALAGVTGIVLTGGCIAGYSVLGAGADALVIPRGLTEEAGKTISVVIPDLSADQVSPEDVAVQTMVGTDAVIRDVYTTDKITVREGGETHTYEAGEDRTFYVITTDPEGLTDVGVSTPDGGEVDLPAAGGTTTLLVEKDTTVSIVDRTAISSSTSTSTESAVLIQDVREYVSEYLATGGGVEQGDPSEAGNVPVIEPSSLSAATPTEALQAFVGAINSGDAATACGYLTPAAVVDVEGNAGACADGGLTGALAWKNYTDQAWLFNTSPETWAFSTNGLVEKALAEDEVPTKEYVKVAKDAAHDGVGFDVVVTADGSGWQVDVLPYKESR